MLKHIGKLTDHVVQLEAITSYIVILVVLTFILAQLGGAFTLPIWIVSGVMLIMLKPIIRVTNPTDSVRNRLTWAAVFGGALGSIAGATTDILAGGLTGGQGTLAGFSAGAAIGGVTGDWIQNWGNQDKLIGRGEAFDFLYRNRRKSPKVANPSLIDIALDNDIPSFDKDRDGRNWYAISDLREYLQR